MPRFVLLAHDFPTPHWDLMLESDGVLRTWRLHSIPESGKPVPAEAIGNHRLAYLDYEGPVSGNRGSVARVDGGELEWHICKSDHAVAILYGARLSGRIQLVTVGDRWVCKFGD